MHILFSFLDNRIVWGMYKNNSALTFHLDRGILVSWTRHFFSNFADVYFVVYFLALKGYGDCIHC